MPDSPDLLTIAQALIARLEEMTQPLNDLCVFRTVHGMPYTGPNWGEPLAALRAAVDAAKASHVYVSTACQHAKHERCRQRCKFCAVNCGCPCHVELFPITGDAAKAAGDDGAYEACAKLLTDSAYKLDGAQKRTNQVDANTAYVLRDHAAKILAMASERQGEGK